MTFAAAERAYLTEPEPEPDHFEDGDPCGCDECWATAKEDADIRRGEEAKEDGR